MSQEIPDLLLGTYDPWLVALSVSVAVLASFLGLDLASRVAARQRPAREWRWIIGGALAIGAGTWSMHFIGMLAYRLPIPVSFDLALTAASFALPVAAAGAGLRIASRPELGMLKWLAGGTIIGIGIFAMHYTGMAAMKMRPPIVYTPWLVGASAAVAVAASVASLRLAFAFRMDNLFEAVGKKAASAALLGSSIAAMHYIAMAAANIPADSVCTAYGSVVSPAQLAYAVGGIVLLVNACALLLSAYDSYRTEVASRRSAELQLANIDLEKRVAERTEELATAHRKLVDVQEAERRHIVAELHDQVGQNLAALSMNLDLLERKGGPLDDSARARLADAHRLVESTTDSIEGLMSELRPPALDDLGLQDAIRWHAETFSRRTGIETEWLSRAVSRRFAPEVETALFRIVQEALTNVAKHSRASRVRIELAAEGNECVLSVSDNGVGLDPAPPTRPSYGIVTMKERAQSIGGRLKLSTAPAGGTVLTVRFPCRDSHADPDRG